MRLLIQPAFLCLNTVQNGRREPEAFTLIELLVAISIIAILASLLLPVLSRAKRQSQQTKCLGNLRQIGLAMSMYVSDSNQRFPNRRDLKSSLPGGWKPWASWPTSDPRSGWAAIVLDGYIGKSDIWSCAAARRAPFKVLIQLAQSISTNSTAQVTRYWMWRFDRPDDPIPLDNFWGKTEEQAVADLQLAKNPTASNPFGPGEVELVVDGYFPATIPAVDVPLQGRSVHPGGRNRQFMDGHGAFLKDPRTPR